MDFVAAITAHAKDRRLTKVTASYWVCAYAHNHWQLDDALTADPAQTSFHRAMAICKGTVTVVDKEGVLFSRIWCAYESYVMLSSEQPWDIYTAGCERKENDPESIVRF